MRRWLTLLLFVLGLVFCTLSAAFAEENGFVATVGDTGDTYGYYNIEPGKTATLTANARCDKGSLTYQWKDSQWKEIEGATGATYKTGAIEGATSYSCIVRDEYGNSRYLYFYIRVENHLDAYVVGREYPKVLPGNAATLKVKASCDKGSLTYQWKKGYSEVIEGATTASFNTGALNERASYSCVVSDQYGNSQTVYFTVGIENKLKAYADGPYQFNVRKGESATLKVDASCYKGSLTYQWQKDYEDIEGAKGKTYDTGALDKYARYNCRVTDEYGNTESVYYSIGIKNDLGIENVGPGRHVVKPGASLTLKVNPSAAKGDVTCSWQSYGNELGEATGTTLTLNDIQRSMQVYCHVKDIYGNTDSEYFEIVVDNKLKIRAKGETSMVVAPGKPFTLSVIASCAKGDLSYVWSQGDLSVDGSYISYRNIQSPTEATLKEEGIEQTTYYRCLVSDNYGNSAEVKFDVRIDNGFSVAASGNTKLKVASGKNVTAKVNASCKTGPIHYIWTSMLRDGDTNTSYSSRVLDCDTASCTVKNVTQSMSLTCRAFDEYGNSDSIMFDIAADNALTAASADGEDNSRLTVMKGGSVTMKVAASCNVGSISYQWYRVVPDGSSFTMGNPVVGASSNTCTIKNIQACERYQCNVWDEYGNSDSVSFDISLENEFTASIQGSPLVLNKKGESIKLQVSASSTAGDVSYQWFTGGTSGYYAIKDATNSSYTVPKDSIAGFYSCMAEDQSGNRKSLRFLYLPADTPTLSADQSATVDIDEKNGLAAFVFKPSKTSFYTFTSVGTKDTHGILYDSDFTQLAYDYDSGENENFLFSARLTAGRQYVLIAKFSSSNEVGSFAVTLNSGSKVKSVEMDLPLLVGQTVTLPDLYGEGSIKVVEGKCLTRKGQNVVYADSTGSASVTVVYDGMVAVYDVTVEKADKIVRLPEALKKIDSEAFLGDSALKYVEVGEKTTEIGSKAFANSALKQIVVMGTKTSLNAKALTGTKAVVLCRKGSAAETFASKNNITYAYIG